MHRQHGATRAQVPLDFVVGKAFLARSRVRLDRVAREGALRVDHVDVAEDIETPYSSRTLTRLITPDQSAPSRRMRSSILAAVLANSVCRRARMARHSSMRIPANTLESVNGKRRCATDRELFRRFWPRVDAKACYPSAGRGTVDPSVGHRCSQCRCCGTNTGARMSRMGIQSRTG